MFVFFIMARFHQMFVLGVLAKVNKEKHDTGSLSSNVCIFYNGSLSLNVCNFPLGSLCVNVCILLTGI